MGGCANCTALRGTNWAHDAICDDPCHLAWQVKKILWLDSPHARALRPLPARPAGESDSDADELQSWAKWQCFSKAAESDSPATQGGRGLNARGYSSSDGISFTCRT